MGKKILLILISIGINYAYAQNYIYDLEAKTPIEMVHVFYNQNKGLISNEDGFFELPNHVRADTIHFSHISYRSKGILFRDLKERDTIFMEGSPISLDEVIISSYNPNEIVKKAIEGFKDNYIETAYNISGFYRQSSEEDSKGVEMVEVDFISYIDSKKRASTKVLNARRTKNYSSWGIKTIGGVASVIEQTHNPFEAIDFLDINKLDEYKYQYLGIINNNGTTVYKIGFEPADKENLEALKYGEIFIDSDSFAIMEMYYSFDEDKLIRNFEKRLAENKSKINLKKLYLKRLKITNHLSYRKNKNNKWALSFMKSENIYKGIYKEQSCIYNLTGTLVVNQIKTDKPKRVRTNYSTHKDFSKSVKRYDNLEKWGDNYKFSLSKNDKRILNDINEKNN